MIVPDLTAKPLFRDRGPDRARLPLDAQARSPVYVDTIYALTEI